MEITTKRFTTALVLSIALAFAASADAAMFGRKGECGVKIVSFQVTGEAGEAFTYAGKSWTIPAHGTIEILAKKNVKTITVSHEPFDLGEHEPDPMGIVTVSLEELTGRRAVQMASTQ